MRRLCLLLSLFCAGGALAQSKPAIDRAALIARIAESGEGTWGKVQAEPLQNVSSREIFAVALAWCEAGTHPERMERLFEIAARMQDRDPTSRSYGNFRWSWNHETIFDYNAVDFSMRGGALLWLRHRDKLPPAVREKLHELLTFGTEGSLRHKVRESYTNIALMNAGNLILLGEGLENPAAAREGYQRLERVLLYTAEGGIHEYSSPTYYGVDLDDLLLIEAFCRDEKGREQARILLDLFWHDIALNFLPAAQKYAGANSRSYDYLYGLGDLDTHLQLAGWIEGEMPKGVDGIYPLLGRWQPPADLLELSKSCFPRTVRQVWGLEPDQTRTHFLMPDVTLSTASASYGGRMDFPLTVDLAGPRESVRCYFTSDGRGDPYGKKRIAESTNRPESHQKALHLSPFWAAAQRESDALGLVVYRDGDVPTEMPQLQSHFVMPRDADAIFIGERPVKFEPRKKASFPVAPGEAVVLRKGNAAVGVRVPWANGASLALVDDGNKFGAVRFTVDHRSAGSGALRAAAFHVRIGSGLKSDADFGAWRSSLAAAACEANSNDQRVSLKVAGLAVDADAPFNEPSRIDPAPARSVLELNGKDIGQEILNRAAPVREQAAADARKVPVLEKSPALWEAEAGRIVPAMEVAEDPKASGGHFVWAPNGVGANGSVRWRLDVAEPGTYFLWGRVLASTPEDDSFAVRVTAGGKPLIERTDWPVGVRPTWKWVILNQPKTRDPLALNLPAGESILEVIVREDGTKVDRLFLARDVAARPPE